MKKWEVFGAGVLVGILAAYTFIFVQMTLARLAALEQFARQLMQAMSAS